MRNTCWREIGRALLGIVQPTEAIRIAELDTEPNRRDHTLRRIAVNIADQDPEEAERIVSNLIHTNIFAHDAALGEIALIVARRDLTEAERLARKILFSGTAASVITELTAQVAKTDRQRATALLGYAKRRIEYAPDARLLGEMARWISEWNQPDAMTLLDDAIAHVDRTSDSKEKLYAILNLIQYTSYWEQDKANILLASAVQILPDLPAEDGAIASLLLTETTATWDLAKAERIAERISEDFYRESI